MHLSGYLAARECEVVGMGDTRLGGDASELTKLARAALGGLYNDDTNTYSSDIDNDDETGPRPPAVGSTKQPRPRVALAYDAAGSHKTANDIWRGGVVLGSFGEATKRMERRIDDCRGWGRYVGRVYRGVSKKTLVVVEVYFPDAAYEPDDLAREDYSQPCSAS